jgi:hypothetical protein
MSDNNFGYYRTHGDIIHSSFCKAFSNITRIENLLKIWKDYESQYYPVYGIFDDITDLRNFAERIPTNMMYVFHEGDSFLIDNNDLEHCIGYSDTSQLILDFLQKGGYNLESAQKLCNKIASILDVSPFRHLGFPTGLDFLVSLHSEKCRCLECEFDKTGEKLRDLEISYEELSKKIIINGVKTPISGPLRHEVFKRDRYRCCDCGATKDENTLEIDHIIPKSQGGKDVLDNLQTLCKTCNRSKHNRYWVGGQ